MTSFADVFRTLSESYQDRVNQVADQVKAHLSAYGPGDEKPDVKGLVDYHARDSLEHRLGGAARRDFHKDVHSVLKPYVSKMNRSNSAKSRADNLSAFHSRLAGVINDGIGRSIPDGDPHDHIHPRMIRLAMEHGIKDKNGYPADQYSDMSHHMDKAARVNGYDSYDHQLQSAWDDHHSQGYHDAVHSNDQRGIEHHAHGLANNPWGKKLDPARPSDWMALKMKQRGVR